MADDVRATYTSLLGARREAAKDLARRDRAIAYGRLAVIAAGVATVGILGVTVIAVFLPLSAFLALVLWHARVLRAKARADRAVSFYERGLRRIDDRFQGEGDDGSRYVDEDHLYAQDLDLFGRGSLYELLSLSRTRRGQDILARWLLGPASSAEVRARQAAVRELGPALEAREALAVLEEDVLGEVHPEALSRWGRAPAVLTSRWPPLAALFLAASSVAAIALYALDFVGTLPVYVALTLELLLAGMFRSRVHRVIREVEAPARELLLLSGAFALVEQRKDSAPRLAEIAERLRAGGRSPAAEIRRLRRLVDFLDGRRNPFFAPVAALLLWSTQIAHAIEIWRAANGRHIDTWLEALGEWEALLSFSGFAYERPEDVFPEVSDAGPLFHAEGLGHPLIPGDRLVRNDVELGQRLALLIVSGSNMSGKSTLLRTVGVATVMALAGAPVRARRLVVSPLAVSASIRIQDSLQGGVSRFYAEITRVRRIVDLLGGPIPVLFLLDELLQGTNSHDRRIGAEAVVRNLVERGAVGLITTHDLALVQIADALEPRAVNVHFEDHLEDGKVTFDYRLRPGVVQKSNALALMRAVGLEV